MIHQKTWHSLEEAQTSGWRKWKHSRSKRAPLGVEESQRKASWVNAAGLRIHSEPLAATVHLILKLYMPGSPDVNTNKQNPSWLRGKSREWKGTVRREAAVSLSPVSAVWGLNPWDDRLFQIYVLAWLILVTPSNSLGLPLPTQSGMLRWWATWPKICLNSPDFTLSASFLPQQEGSISTSICSRRGCWEREKGEEIGRTKGVEGHLVSQVPRPPGELDVSCSHCSHSLGELLSPAGLDRTYRPAGRSIWSPRVPVGPKASRKEIGNTISY